jgi:hypothetical protein
MSAPLWAVGSYVDGAGRRASWRISHDEINCDIGTATNVLRELGVAGSGVLWCSMLAEAGQFWPYVCGTVMAGGRLSCADATRGEATRVAMFLRLMPYGAVFGITDAILDGLADLERDPRDVFADVRILGANPGAYERLVALGMAPTRFALCGPAVAIARELGGPAYVASDAWELDSDGAGICVTARQPRAQEFTRTPVGVRGTIEDGGITW